MILERIKTIQIPERYRQVAEKYREPSIAWLVLVLIAGALAWYWDRTEEVPSTTAQVDAPEAADTFIPAGYVLVPIDVANSEALDSILGKFGVIDLYIPTTEPRQRPIKVASRIKILRAPLNPNRFAVLAPESESARIVAHAGPFAVSVQNPKSTGTVFEAANETVPEPASARSLATRGKGRSRIEVEVLDAP